jgi:hypothetical protein
MVHFPKIPLNTLLQKIPPPLLFVLYIIPIIPIDLFPGLSLQNKKSPFAGDFLSTGIPI